MTLHGAAWSGLLAQAVLALLFLLVWQRLRPRWALLLTLGYATQALVYVLLLLGQGHGSLERPPSTGPALAAVVGLVLISAAVIDYVALPRHWSRRLHAASVGVAALALLIGLAGWLSRGAGMVVMATYVIGWAVLFLDARRREPHSGHGIVALALLAYPATVGAGMAGWIDPHLLSVAGVLPFSVLGATLLATSLLRAQARAMRAADERELARAALAAANAGLEQEVAQRTAALRETIEGLESFTRSVSHDLRGPLGGIAGLAQLAREALDRGDAATARRLLAAVEQQAQDSIQLVASLLALSRASDAPLHRRPVDPAPLAREAMAQLAIEAPQAAVEIGRLPSVNADPDLLRQVFANLIGNALKFCRGREGARVEVGAVQSPAGTAIFVRDNGAGFEPGDAERLFKPFQRLHGRAYEGTGVGLSIVKRIVERHGGRAWAEGRPQQGATFWFSLGQ